MDRSLPTEVTGSIRVPYPLVVPIIGRMNSSSNSEPSTEPADHSDSSASPGEFELITTLKRMVDAAPAAPNVVVGIGDDAAAVELEAGVHVMTTDTMVDGVHFLRGKADWADVGWKSAVSNLSDIAAMGAVPLHAMVTIGVPPDISADEMEQMYRGLTDAFTEFGGGIVGGDVVSSPVFFVTVALTGRAREIDGVPVVLQRDIAQLGDLIGVTGNLGGSAGGLRAIIDGLQSTEANELIRLHYRPIPRVKEAEALVESGVLCAMDVSDGLMADLEKICTASEVGAVINSPDVPIPKELTALFGDDALQMALAGGEDYELVFTAPFDLMDRLLARHRGRVKHIGRITDEPATGDRVVAVDANGEPIELTNRGWDHLDAK